LKKQQIKFEEEISGFSITACIAAADSVLHNEALIFT